MQKVITVSLNGNAYQLDEDAYLLLAQYLEQSARALQNNPDRQEIIADLEQAIGEKCARYLNPHKTVVTGAELAQVVAQMGPVDGDPGTAAGPSPGATPNAEPAQAGGDTVPGVSRRLYQISDGAVFSGVCKGLAAYFAVDVTLVRAIFVALFLLTGGLALIGYVVLMFIVPYASTSEERAAAHGLPFNARVLVERAKQKYTQFAQSSDWRDSRNQWGNEWRRARASFASGTRAPAASYATHIITGTVLAILGLIFAVFTIGWVLAMLSLATTGALLGWPLPDGLPFWAAMIALLLLYNAVAWPIKAMRRSVYYSVGPYQGAWVEAWNGIVVLAVIFALVWYGYHHLPELHSLINHLSQWWHESASVHLERLHFGERPASEDVQDTMSHFPLL